MNYRNFADNIDLIKLIMTARGSGRDSKDTEIINAVIQSGMAMFLHSLKQYFTHFIIVGHPTTLRYCEKVLGKSEYVKRILWLPKIDFAKYKEAAIISDSHENDCDLYIDLDYYKRTLWDNYDPIGKSVGSALYCHTTGLLRGIIMIIREKMLTLSREGAGYFLRVP